MTENQVKLEVAKMMKKNTVDQIVTRMINIAEALERVAGETRKTAAELNGNANLTDKVTAVVGEINWMVANFEVAVMMRLVAQAEALMTIEAELTR